MTQAKSELFINRILVWKSGKPVLDLSFHLGVNIIRGENSVGKTTIMEFIFFALGGDIRKERWTTQAASCEHVTIEVNVNGRVFSMRRYIDPDKKPPTLLTENTIEETLNSPVDWVQYGIIRSDNKYSFSQMFFELLGWPAHKLDGNANLTMHQILRLIYVDQETSANRILKTEPSFDSANGKQAIGDFLLGVDDLGAFDIQQKLSKLNAEFDKIKGQLDAVYKFISPTEGVLRSENIREEISDLETRANDTEKHISRKLLESDISEINVSAEVHNQTNELAKRISTEAKTLDQMISIQSQASDEIVESKLFLSSLDQRIKSLQESRSTFEILGDIKFRYCPSCLSDVNKADAQGLCHLCKTEISESKREEFYLAALNELHFQQKESRKVLDIQEQKLKESNNRIYTTRTLLESLRSEHRSLLVISNDRMLNIARLSIELGGIKQKIEQLNSKAKLVSSVQGLQDKKEELQALINSYEDQLTQLKAQLSKRRRKLESALSQRTVSLIRQDHDYETAFSKSKKFTFSFQDDIMLVDDISRFSASSEIILKNSFHLAILMESLTDPKVRYPRLLLLDNIEDNGMVQERSQNFQNVAIQALEGYTQDFQVIMTTSMIAPNLEGSDYCVGRFYSKGDHTLEI